MLIAFPLAVLVSMTSPSAALIWPPIADRPFLRIGPMTYGATLDQTSLILGRGTRAQTNGLMGPFDTATYTDGRSLLVLTADTQDVHEIVMVEVIQGLVKRVARLPKRFGLLSDWRWSCGKVFESVTTLRKQSCKSWKPDFATSEFIGWEYLSRVHPGFAVDAMGSKYSGPYYEFRMGTTD
jgi:hypothetical protein